MDCLKAVFNAGFSQSGCEDPAQIIGLQVLLQPLFMTGSTIILRCCCAVESRECGTAIRLEAGRLVTGSMTMKCAGCVSDFDGGCLSLIDSAARVDHFARGFVGQAGRLQHQLSELETGFQKF